jgi:hypothetical protein
VVTLTGTRGQVEAVRESLEGDGFSSAGDGIIDQLVLNAVLDAAQRSLGHWKRKRGPRGAWLFDQRDLQTSSAPTTSSGDYSARVLGSMGQRSGEMRARRDAELLVDAAQSVLDGTDREE